MIGALPEPTMHPQSAILADLPPLARYLTFDCRAADPADALKLLAGVPLGEAAVLGLDAILDGM